MINSDFGIDRTKTRGRKPPLHVAKGIRSHSEASKQNRTFLVFMKICYIFLIFTEFVFCGYLFSEHQLMGR